MRWTDGGGDESIDSIAEKRWAQVLGLRKGTGRFIVDKKGCGTQLAVF